MMRILAFTLVLASGFAAAREAGQPAALHPGSSDREIMEHMYQTELNQAQTDALAEHFPDISRDRAYAIQRLRLEDKSRLHPRAGWKLAWTRKTEDSALDPALGHYLADRVYHEGEPVSTRHFTNGTAAAEPEIVFYLDKDLPGPVVSREQVIDAVASIGIAMEFVAWRALGPQTREHAIIDNGIAAGVLLADERFALDAVDFTRETGSVTVNGGETNSGPATSIMGEDPLAALVWAANELPKYGMHLKAGDFVVSGTVCVPLRVSAGDTASISFTSLGSLNAEFVE
jgi:2-keto-4-pentenoate hydratase